MVWLYILTSFLLGILIALAFSQRFREKAVGICSYALEQSVAKQKNKEKILKLLGNKGEISNRDIQEELQVNSRSVVRYMDELEKEGKVSQVGNTGRSVTYQLSKV